MVMEIDQKDIPLWNKFTRTPAYQTLMREHAADTSARDRWIMWLAMSGYEGSQVFGTSNLHGAGLELWQEYRDVGKRRDFEITQLWLQFKERNT